MHAGIARCWNDNCTGRKAPTSNEEAGSSDRAEKEAQFEPNKHKKAHGAKQKEPAEEVKEHDGKPSAKRKQALEAEQANLNPRTSQKAAPEAASAEAEPAQGAGSPEALPKLRSADADAAQARMEPPSAAKARKDRHAIRGTPSDRLAKLAALYSEGFLDNDQYLKAKGMLNSISRNDNSTGRNASSSAGSNARQKLPSQTPEEAQVSAYSLWLSALPSDPFASVAGTSSSSSFSSSAARAQESG